MVTSTVDFGITKLRARVRSGGTGLAWRRSALLRLQKLLTDGQAELLAALAGDLGKSAEEALLTELSSVNQECRYLLRQLQPLQRWWRERPLLAPLAVQPAAARVSWEPYGVILVLAPWNYPVNLTLAPAAGALAAGNTVLLKPSELAPRTAEVLQRLVATHFAPDEMLVINGDGRTAQELLEHQFDKIVFTGGTAVGKLVAAAAATHLTPTLLELGGKSPLWVDESADLPAAADRLAYAKFVNAGQTCVAPDYLLCTPAVAADLLPLLRESIMKFYGTDPRHSPHYGRIVNDRQAARLAELAGLPQPSDRYLPPTILTDPTAVARTRDSEIFGPVLPVEKVPNLSAALELINAQPPPLAVYAMTRSRLVRRRLRQETRSGSLVFGAPVVQLAAPQLPFGGVGASGYGNYRGKWSLQAFSHPRAIFRKPLTPDTLRVIYPPYRRLTRTVQRWLSRS